jgi:N-acetylglucosamine-6-phosphate deacetylase
VNRTLTGRVVLADRVLDRGRVRIAEDRIVAVGEADGPVDDQWITPGLIDVHVHGGGGHTMTSGNPGEALAAVAFHQRHGTTSTVCSLVTTPVDGMCRTAAALASIVDGGQVVGLHLEGPFVSAARCGALDAASMRDPDLAVLGRLLDAGAGTVRTMTFAPELPGALDLVGALRAAGVAACVGHTDATHDQVRAALEAGAAAATHLGNAMRGFHHREPGPIGALLGAPGVVCEVICDGVHVHPAAVALFAQAAGDEGIALVTDAVAAAGAGDGTFDLGGHRVEVREGVARVAGTGTLAGSTLTMDAALRRAVRDVGLSPVAACRAAATNPARVLGVADRTGEIAPGMAADLCVFDDDWALTEVVARGASIIPG